MGFSMRLMTVDEGKIDESTFNSPFAALETLRKIGGKYYDSLAHRKKLTTDMDGVLIYDDNAVAAARVVAGASAEASYGQASDLNIAAALKNEVPYCWYAPTFFMSKLMNGLPIEINRTVGMHMRLVPGAEEFVDHLGRENNWEITAVTAGHQEAAREVSRRIGIKATVGTQLGFSDDRYDGSIGRFIGGTHKLSAVQRLLRNGSPDSYDGTHIGDSWSDVDALAGIPNSIAFNPGCDLALRNARVSVIGTSLEGLIPLFSDNYQPAMHDLPQAVVVMQNSAGVDLSRILDFSRKVKREDVGSRVEERYGNYAGVEQRIRQSLKQSGINYSATQGIPPIDSSFDDRAKRAYRELTGA
ncbi:MAG: HAD family hydrolase [Nanoarchaeota archaeon]|nr:HAD family hydrolase [Nanoarchaeota archaeon]